MSELLQERLETQKTRVQVLEQLLKYFQKETAATSAEDAEQIATEVFQDNPIFRQLAIDSFRVATNNGSALDYDTFKRMLDSTVNVIGNLEAQIKQSSTKRAHDRVVSSSIKKMGKPPHKDGSGFQYQYPSDLSENNPIKGSRQ